MKMRSFGIVAVMVALALSLVLLNPGGAAVAKAQNAPDEGVVEFEFGTESSLIAKSMSLIEKASSNSVTIAGSTETYYPVERVSVTVYLQKYVNGSWVNVDYVYRARNGVRYVYTEKTITVERGYYYRTRGVHYAKDGVTTQTTYTTTGSLYM